MRSLAVPADEEGHAPDSRLMSYMLPVHPTLMFARTGCGMCSLREGASFCLLARCGHLLGCPCHADSPLSCISVFVLSCGLQRH